MKALIFVYLLTYGGAAAALFNPFYGLLAYVCLAIVRPEWLWHWVAVPENHSRIVAIAMCVGWAAQNFGGWRLGRGKAATLAFAGFWCWAALSAGLAAQNQAKAFWYVEVLGKVLVPFLVGVTTIRTVRQVRILAWTIVLSLGYVAYDLNLSYYGGYNRLYAEGFGAMDNNCVAIALVTGTGLSVFLGLSVRRWREKCLAFLAASLMMNAIFFSYSRGGMLALVLMAIAGFFLVPKRPSHYFAFFVIVAIGYRLMGGGAVARFVTAFANREDRDRSAQSRVEMWRDCWDVMLRHPVLGCGPENWGDIAPQYGWPQGRYAHSLWVQTGAETGFPGLALLAGFYGATLLGAWRLIRRPPPLLDPFLQNMARAVLASLSGFAVAAQFVSLWGLEVPYYVALLGAATLKVAGMESELAATEAASKGLPYSASGVSRERLWPAG